MTAASQDTAARLLFDRRKAGIAGPRLPESCRPADADAALAIQRRIDELAGATIGGWKCSAPSAARPILAAPIWADMIIRSSPARLPTVEGIAKIEPEVAFVLGRDLPQRAAPYTEAEVRAAIADTRLVLELVASRYADPSACTYPESLADHVSNFGLFVGPSVPGGAGAALERIEIEMAGPGKTLLKIDGAHPDGHPLRPLVWLASFLAGRGLPLRAGQIVTTGSYAGLVEAPVGVPLSLRFGGLGILAVELASA